MTPETHDILQLRRSDGRWAQQIRALKPITLFKNTHKALINKWKKEHLKIKRKLLKFIVKHDTRFTADQMKPWFDEQQDETLRVCEDEVDLLKTKKYRRRVTGYSSYRRRVTGCTKIAEWASRNEDFDTCPICLENLVANENGAVVKNQCGHMFHRNCIARWDNQHNDYDDTAPRGCPCCREPVERIMPVN